MLTNKERVAAIANVERAAQDAKKVLYQVAQDLSSSGCTGAEGELIKALEFIGFAQKRLVDARERLA